MRRSRTLASLGALAISATLMTPLSAVAAPPTDAPGGPDTFEPGDDIEQYPIEGLTRAQARQLAEEAAEEQRERKGRGTETAPGQQKQIGPQVDLPEANPAPEPARDYTDDELVGQLRTWLALNNRDGVYYFKTYRLAAVGDNIEVWVALESETSYNPETGVYTLPFPQDDCRNTTYDGARVEITPEQLNGLVADFDLNIHPLETDVFRTPPDRNGEDAILPGLVGLPDDYYATEGGAGRTVTLIDNVRDANYYTPPDEEQLSYIAGFFSSQLNDLFDRNTMTVDAFDWVHRTGPNPPNDPSEDPCLNATSRPFLYEGVFAHEWQHLLQSYTGEVTWLNEGLSDWAQTLTGYVDPSVPITESGYDSHVQCFYGYLAEQHPTNPIPREDSGPENSLTWWEDQGDDEVLCDYGAAYTMIEYLVGQLGLNAATFLHNDPATGLTSVDALLDEAGDDRTSMDILHDWAAMIALDAALDDNRGRLSGDIDADRLRTPTLDASVRWEGDDAYDTPGAPPNGSDYVRLRDASGDYLDANDLRSLTFAGAAEYEPAPVEWTVVADDGDQVLYSGNGNALDRSIAFATTVPAADPTLTFETRYEIEYGWDFGFVQVSSDGGETWSSLSGDLTTTDHADNPSFREIAAQLPGLTGTSVLTDAGEGTFVDNTNDRAEADWITATFDLSSFAGQDILIGFRYMTDGAFVLPGWWVDDIAVGGTVMFDGSTTDGFQSYKQINPDDVAGWTLQLVSIDPSGRRQASLLRYDIEPGETLTLSRSDLQGLIGNNDLVGAIVTLDEPTESVLQYAPYTLEVNGVAQPGGS